MHASLKGIVSDLQARLPELEFKINSIGFPLSVHTLPPGLFQLNKERTAKACIDEIKSDLFSLSKQSNLRSADYLAQRIRRKINVLVTLCHIHSKKKDKPQGASFGMETLGTRKQWIEKLEEDVVTLTRQRDAMLASLDKMKYKQDVDAVLNLQADLGVLEHKLTLAKEVYEQQIS